MYYTYYIKLCFIPLFQEIAGTLSYLRNLRNEFANVGGIFPMCLTDKHVIRLAGDKNIKEVKQ